jgi:hypothetical protein
MRAATKGYNGACVGTTRFLRPKPYSRLKHIVSDVTFSIPWHRTEGTKSQSSDHQERRVIASIRRDDHKKRKNKKMKLSNISSGLLLGMTLLLATGASAASKGALKLDEAVSVNGTHLAKGEYEVTWDGTGPNVELNVIQSKKIVATVPARLVQLNHPGPGQGYGTRKEEDGTTSLTSIYFSGKKYELAIGKESVGAESTKGSGQN